MQEDQPQSRAGALFQRGRAKVAETMEERSARAAHESEHRRQQEAEHAEYVRTLPMWEYWVMRVGSDKQKGVLGGSRMQDLFNDAGAGGWELVAINEERATFKRMLPPRVVA